MDRPSIAFNPAQYPDVPLYNIQAVSAATGVPAITLRSWERRYGVPEPKRDVKGYRLYSQRDIAVTQWLRQRVEEGVSISRAVNILRVLQTTGLDEGAATGFDLSVLTERLLDAIRHFDEDQVGRIVAEALTVVSVEEACLQLVQPVLYHVGELWERGDLSVTVEHVGSNLLRAHLTQLIRITPPPCRQQQILIGCAPGELHDMGALMVTLFARRRGYDAIYAGASLEADDFLSDVVRLRPAAVCLSAATPATAAQIEPIYHRLQADFNGLLAYGGRAFNLNPELQGSLPGLYLGGDAGAALHGLAEHLNRAA